METGGGFLISQIKQIQARIFGELLREAGIEEFNGAQGRILYVLWDEDDVPVTALARRTGLAKTTLTSMLDRLEASGFLRREPDAADRRQTRVVLTPLARSMSDRYDAVSARMTAIFYEGFSPQEIAVFESALRRILRNLQEKEEGL